MKPFSSIYGLNYRNNIVVYSYFVVPYIVLFLSFAITHGCATRFISAVIDYGATYFKYICTELEQFDEDYNSFGIEQREYLMKKIIKDHQRGLQICERVETSFNLNFLFQFSINIFYICFILFDLNIVSEILAVIVIYYYRNTDRNMHYVSRETVKKGQSPFSQVRNLVK